MKRKTNLTERTSLPYESPDMAFVEVKAEGVLCQSEATLFDETPGLEDYNPSNGVW